MSDIIRVSIKNNVYLEIGCEIDQAYELKEFFSCYATNYKYHPKYKARMWNGKISFFDIYERLLPIGLLKYLKVFAKKFKYRIKLDFNREDLRNDITDEDLTSFYDALFSGVTNNGNPIYPRDYQHKAILSALKYKRGIVEAATGCHSKGTRVIRHDGTYVNVEDVCVGDRLMGPSGERTVLKLYSGIDSMYKITPKRGKPFMVNKDHILHLKFTGGSRTKNRHGGKDYVNISVEDYLKENKTFKHETKLVYNSGMVEFDNKNIDTDIGKLTPYFIGLYLGDGHTHHCMVTTMDDELKDYIEHIVNKYGLTLKPRKNKSSSVRTYIFHGCAGKRHPILRDFEKLGLKFGVYDDRVKCDEKFVPDVIKYGSVHSRLDCIAGLIDSDGHLGKGRKSFEFCVSSERLASDMAFMCRSVGLYVRESVKVVNDVDYYRLSISGDTSIIPTKLPRKQSSGCRHDRGSYVQGFDIEYINDDSYYGFGLDGDNLYFLDDFCITHNSGKSIMIYSMIRFMMEDVEGKVLLIVPSISLVTQMASDFREYGWYDSYDDVSLLYGNSKHYDPNKKVLISTWQSIYKKGQKFFEQFDAVIVDETHSAKSSSIQTVLKKCVNASYKIGLTGTLPIEPIDRFNIFGYLGTPIYNLRSEELIRRGFLTDIRIINTFVRYSAKDIKQNTKRTYAEEIDFIIKNDKRNKVLKYIIDSKHVKTTDNILILAQRLNHIDKIVEYLGNEYPDRTILKISGNTNAEEREKIRQDVEKLDGVILVATYGTLSTGVNIPKLHHVIFASFYKSKIKVLQSIGRGLRKHKSKKIIYVWDIIDDMRWKKTERKNSKNKYGFNYAVKHFFERLSYYKEQGFKFKDMMLKLEEL